MEEWGKAYPPPMNPIYLPLLNSLRVRLKIAHFIEDFEAS